MWGSLMKKALWLIVPVLVMAWNIETCVVSKLAHPIADGAQDPGADFSVYGQIRPINGLVPALLATVCFVSFGIIYSVHRKRRIRESLNKPSNPSSSSTL